MMVFNISKYDCLTIFPISDFLKSEEHEKMQFCPKEATLILIIQNFTAQTDTAQII